MPHALVVDDDADAAEMLATLIAAEGFTVATAGSLREARRQMVLREPDAVLLDLMLPDGNGMQLLDDLKAFPGTEVVLITGHASVDSSVQALRLGAADYLVKPINIKQLKGVLSRVRRPSTLSADAAGLLAMLERRSARRTWLSPEEQSRLARLGHLRRVLAALSALTQRMDSLETETLGTFHLAGGFDAAALQQSQNEIQNERLQLQRDLFRFSFAQPDDIVVAIYSEHRDWMQQMISIYIDHAAALEGKLIGFEFVRPPEGHDLPDSKPRREPPRKLGAPMEKPPGGWVGAIMHLRGDLFHPRFMLEAGLHKHLSKGVNHLCLVEASATNIAEYMPPAGIHRAGAITDKGARPRRIFNADELTLSDAVMGSSTWTRTGPDVAVCRLIEARLVKAVEDMA